MTKRIKRRTSVIWKLPKDQFKQLVLQSQNLGQILKYFDLPNHGGNSNTVKKRIKEEEIDISHIVLGLNNRKGKPSGIGGFKRQISNEKLFVENSSNLRSVVRVRILKEKLIPYICKICNHPPEWLGKPLTLILDHINGKNNDHRLENLRFLCPMCNIQTDTFGSKKRNIAC